MFLLVSYDNMNPVRDSYKSENIISLKEKMLGYYDKEDTESILKHAEVESFDELFELECDEDSSEKEKMLVMISEINGYENNEGNGLQWILIDVEGAELI